MNKKLIVLTLVAALVMALPGCGKDKTEEAETVVETVEPEVDPIAPDIQNFLDA